MPDCQKPSGRMPLPLQLISSIVFHLQPSTWRIHIRNYLVYLQIIRNFESSDASASHGYGHIQITSLKTDQLHVCLLVTHQLKAPTSVFRQALVGFMSHAMSNLMKKPSPSVKNQQSQNRSRHHPHQQHR